MSTVDQALETAIAQHRAGQLAAAEAAYRRILDQQPQHADALHLLGAVALVSGRPEEARDLMVRATQLSPLHPVYHSNLGEAYRRLGRLDEAVASLRRALALRPEYPDACNNLGSALAEKQEWPEAIAWFQRATALQPDFADAHGNLGHAWTALERWEEAIASYRRTAALKPDSAGAHNQLANAFVRAGHWDEAMACCKRALELKPDFVKALGNMAVAHLGKDRCDEAIAWGRKALALQPDAAEVFSNLGAAFLRNGQNQMALEYCERAIAADPALGPAHWNYALTLLLLGRFAEGWREYEWRWQAPPLSAFRRNFSAPQWNGSPADGQTILVHAEQGYGDGIQFLRYVPLVKRRANDQRVLVECPETLAGLFASAEGLEAEVIPRRSWNGAELPAFEQQIPLHSLPLALGLLEPYAPARPYLRANPERRAAWRRRLGPGSDVRVGFVWAGNPGHPRDRRRSLPPEKLLPLLGLPGVRGYSLQVEPSGVPEMLGQAGLIDLTEHLTDFAETAALMAELDLIISVDTATAHLAGALGRPVWVLLPLVPDWRWGLEREETPWYLTMRLFRQTADGEWGSVVARVGEECVAFRRRQEDRETMRQ